MQSWQFKPKMKFLYYKKERKRFYFSCRRREVLIYWHITKVEKIRQLSLFNSKPTYGLAIFCQIVELDMESNGNEIKRDYCQ